MFGIWVRSPYFGIWFLAGLTWSLISFLICFICLYRLRFERKHSQKMSLQKTRIPSRTKIPPKEKNHGGYHMIFVHKNSNKKLKIIGGTIWCLYAKISNKKLEIIEGTIWFLYANISNKKLKIIEGTIWILTRNCHIQYKLNNENSKMSLNTPSDFFQNAD